MTKNTNRPSALGTGPRHPPRAPGRVRCVTRPHKWRPSGAEGLELAGVRRRASDPPLERRWHAPILREDGQSVSEYLTVVGVTAATVIACTAMFIAPVARAYIGLFKRLVLQFTSVP